MNTTLDWLFAHSGKVLTPDAWCKLLDVAIIDPDGWRGGPMGNRDMTAPIGLTAFINRLAECTIANVDPGEVGPRYPAGI